MLAPTRKRGYLPENFQDELRRGCADADPGFPG
jgi:hypothetical protein